MNKAALPPLNLNIFPNPIDCIDRPGGVNSVVFDHAVGFLSAGYSLRDENGLHVVHALAQSKDIDVFHCHGLYPIGRDHFPSSYSRANDAILQNALSAKVTVCISEFSANILRHKLHIDPHVTRNGIWTADYRAGGSASGPVLFPKGSLDATSRPDDMQWLRVNTDLPLLSIAKIPGIKSLGQLSRSKFLEVLSSCSIYLGTTKENNSMATMEAMISGVPAVGYADGFNAEWLVSGVGCELVPRGDRIALRDAIRKVRDNWTYYSQSARQYAQIFDWQPVINELIDLYEQVGSRPKSTSVSIVIPAHNYGRFLRDAINSALSQSTWCEIIVVDDNSSDDTLQIAKSYGERIVTLHNETNLGVAESRNRGIRHASGEYIVCLDADDMLHDNFVEAHLKAFTSPHVAIAYAPIALVTETGSPSPQQLFTANANRLMQAAGKNQIPSCCMFPKNWWKKAGGYDKRYTPAEDANFWLKIFSLGGTAVKVSAVPLMKYRVHGNSLSTRGFPNWWKDNQLDYSSPITERDAHITIVLDDTEGAKETLWSLENQEYKNWSCQLAKRNELSDTFPWLNRSTHRKETVLNLKSGTILSPTFLSEYMSQTVTLSETLERVSQ